MKNINLQILTNGMDGEGIARVDGKVYFVEGAIEGENVIANVYKENKNYCRAKTIQVITPSVFRCRPRCPYFGECGGCNLQHINYDKQIEIKKNNIQNLFNKSGFNVVVNDVIFDDKKFEYRNKLTMYVSRRGVLAFNKRNLNELVDVSGCDLVGEKFNEIIKKINFFLKNNKDFGCFLVKGMTIRCVDGVFIFNIILSKKVNLIKFENYLKLNKISYSLYYCINTKNNLPTYPVMFFGGISRVMCEEFGIKYPVYPMSFIQVNTNIKTMIYNKILNLISDDIVVDAYSGAGLLSAVMSQKAKRVFAVEIDKSSSMACEELCKANNIDNLTSINGDCAEVIPDLLKNNNVHTLVLDPARKGIDSKTINAIVDCLPKRIIYLSCNPATLVRDIKLICDNKNYRIKFVQPYDMFPQTSEVETLVELELE